MVGTAIFQLRDDLHSILVLVGLQCQNKKIYILQFTFKTTATACYRGSRRVGGIGGVAGAPPWQQRLHAEDNFVCIDLL